MGVRHEGSSFNREEVRGGKMVDQPKSGSLFYLTLAQLGEGPV